MPIDLVNLTLLLVAIGIELVFGTVVVRYATVHPSKITSVARFSFLIIVLLVLAMAAAAAVIAAMAREFGMAFRPASGAAPSSEPG